MMTFNEQIGKRIADLLASHNMKQVDLVNAGCAKSAHMSHIIKGTTGVSLPVLDLICRTIGVSLSEFFQPFAASAPRLPQYVSELYCICSELSPDDVKVLKIAAERMKAIRNESSRKPEQKNQPITSQLLARLPQAFQYIVLRTGMTIGLLFRKSTPILIASFRSAPAAIAWSPGFIAAMW